MFVKVGVYMKKITNYVLVFVMLFTYFSPFFEIFDIKAEEQNVVEEVSRGKYFIGGIEDEDNYLINLKPHEKTAVTLETEEDYYIQSCSSSNYNVVETNTPEQKKCELVANSYGKVLITLYISNRDGSSVVQEYFYVDVELEKYMELVLSKMPDVIKSYDEYSIVSEYGVSYHTKNDVYEGNQRVFDFEISYDYATVENYGNHISPYTKTKKITHKYSDDINLSNIIKLDKGQKGQFYLNSFTNNYDDYIWVSENNDVVTVDQNGNYEGIGAGKTNIKLYNKKTFEYYNSEVTVIESEFDSIKDLKESLDNSEITIDVNNINNLYGNFNGETNKEYTISNYIVKLFNEKMALDMYFYNNVHNIVCDENGCDFTIQYSDIKNGYTTKNINIENLKIKYSGIHIEYIGSLSLNSEFAINYTSYLPENTEHTIIYDNEYFEQLDNGNYIAKKSGDTEITIIAEGYSDTVSINIRHPQNIYDEFNNYLANLKNIELPYSGLSFQTEEGLTYLEKILEAKIINDYPNENIKSKLIADVSCLSSNSCYVNLRENLNTFYMGSSWLKHLIYVSYTETDLETVNEIININKLLSNPFVVQIDDVIEIENSCLDSDCFSSKLIEHTNLNEIKNNSSLEINYSKLNTFEFKKLIPGGVNYLVTISKGNEILFTKEISIYSNHIVGMDSKLNKNERSNYLKKYVDEILESQALDTDIKTWANAQGWKLSDENQSIDISVDYDFDPEDVKEGLYKVTFSTTGREFKIHTTAYSAVGEEVGLTFFP